MAAAPIFAVTPKILSASVSTANTARDGSGTIADLSATVGGSAYTAPAAGTRIERVVLITTGNPADSVVTMFLSDGTTYALRDEFDLGDPVAASTTIPGWQTEKAYSDLILPSGWKIGFAITVALTAGVIRAWAHGSELT